MTREPGPPRLGLAVAAWITFLASGSVLVLEIAAGRLLAPYVGVSLATYTGIIGVMLAGIALGAWLGGRIADARPPAPLIGPALAAGGLAAMAGVPIVAVVGGAASGTGFGPIVLLAAAGFAAPAAILSAAAPLVVRATLRDMATSGSVVGQLSAAGTGGAILGTFLTGFVLLGLLPTRVLIVAVGVLLVVLGMGVRWWLTRRSPGPPLALAAALLVAAGAAIPAGPCDRESAYYCIAILPDPDRPSGRTLMLDRLRHAYVDLADPLHLEFGYVRRFADVALPILDRTGGAAEVLHIGGGGFSFPRYLRAIAPASRHTVLELDPVVVATARERLGLVESRELRVVAGDARLSIRALPDEGFDLVVGDAFGGLSVPWHLTTREFVAEVDRVLRADGQYTLNLIDGPRLLFVRAEVATLRERFAHVALVASPASLRGESGGNVVLVASHAPIDATALEAQATTWGDGPATEVVTGAALDRLTGSARPLTDDEAPVDQLIAR